MFNNIPLAKPSIDEEEKEAVIEVLESGWLAPGDYNKKFEADFAKMIGVNHAITMNSCASALEIALKANDVAGEVIIPSFTFSATANAVVVTGNAPVFCEVDPETRNVRAEDIEKMITSKTRAVIIVHFGGQVCEMTKIVELCKHYNLLLIEDSAETLGSTWCGKQAGSFGVGCFSFFPMKNITTGEGGMMTCNDDNVAFKARALIGHGISSTTLSRGETAIPWARSASFAGHNYRMSNILAAVGYYQLKKIEEMNGKRVELAKYYDDKINELGLEIITPIVREGATHVYQMYTICVSENIRDELVLYLRENGVGASVHFYPPVHQQDFYKKNYQTEELKKTDLLSSTLITLPMYPDMTFDQVDCVVELLKGYFNKK